MNPVCRIRGDWSERRGILYLFIKRHRNRHKAVGILCFGAADVKSRGSGGKIQILSDGVYGFCRTAAAIIHQFKHTETRICAANGKEMMFFVIIKTPAGSLYIFWLYEFCGGTEIQKTIIHCFFKNKMDLLIQLCNMGKRHSGGAVQDLLQMSRFNGFQGHISDTGKKMFFRRYLVASRDFSFTSNL